MVPEAVPPTDVVKLYVVAVVPDVGLALKLEVNVGGSSTGQSEVSIVHQQRPERSQSQSCRAVLAYTHKGSKSKTQDGELISTVSHVGFKATKPLEVGGSHCQGVCASKGVSGKVSENKETLRT